VTWKPYQIDPGTNIEGETFDDYCQRRWGGSGWTSHLRTEGSKDGAAFADWKWWPNTLKAHQLIRYASKECDNTSASNAAIFEALYEEGENISDVDVLIKIGKEKLGLEEGPLRLYLQGNQGAKDVLEEIDEGRRRYKIRGVPFFVIEGEETTTTPYGISGAHVPETFLDIFEEISEKE